MHSDYLNEVAVIANGTAPLVPKEAARLLNLIYQHRPDEEITAQIDILITRMREKLLDRGEPATDRNSRAVPAVSRFP